MTETLAQKHNKGNRKSKKEALKKYIAVSLEEGEFLPSQKVGENIKLDYTQHWVRDHWDSFNQFRLSALCLVARMSPEEKIDFAVEYCIDAEKIRELAPK